VAVFPIDGARRRGAGVSLNLRSGCWSASAVLAVVCAVGGCERKEPVSLLPVPAGQTRAGSGNTGSTPEEKTNTAKSLPDHIDNLRTEDSGGFF